MKKIKFRELLGILIAIAMIFGWIAMLSAGFRNTSPEGSEASGSSRASRSNPLRYGFHTFLIATPAFVLLSRKRVFSERLSLGMIIFGMFFLCQPFTIVLYRCGFQTLLVGTIAFIFVSHTKMEKKGVGPKSQRL